MLIPFDTSHADKVLAWTQDARELEAWAALDARPDASVFETWHADEDIAAFVLLDAGAPVAYGEIWREPAEREVEFARILVAPKHRRRGVGSRLLLELMERASNLDGVDTFWIRVLPGNDGAIALYAALGFEPAPADEQARLNEPQPRDYVWLRRPA